MTVTCSNTCQRFQIWARRQQSQRACTATKSAVRFEFITVNNAATMSCSESLAGRMSQLSMQDPRSAIQSLIDVHEDLITALQQASAVANQSSSATSVLSDFQRITGCRRTEANYYLKQSNNDIR
jgi:hypothetical protein